MKIAAVIVTYNRLELLKDVLKAFDLQTRHPDYIIVVDNKSSDGTKCFLDIWKRESIEGCEKIVIYSDKNYGGSGGFYIGTNRALETDADWVWVSDDDAVPDTDVFERAYMHIMSLKDADSFSAVCTKVITDGEISLSNRSYRKKTFFNIILDHVAKESYCEYKFECDNFSYVGVFLNRKKLEQVGLIHSEYFIWRDDVEHSWRLSKVGKIICFPDMVVDHRLKSEDYVGVSWKTYYAYRNDLLMLREHCSKRYYFAKECKIVIRGILSKNKRHKKLYFDAIQGAHRDEKGLNPSYCPGMKFED